MVGNFKEAEEHLEFLIELQSSLSNFFFFFNHFLYIINLLKTIKILINILIYITIKINTYN